MMMKCASCGCGSSRPTQNIWSTPATPAIGRALRHRRVHVHAGTGPDGPEAPAGPGPSLSDPVQTIQWGGTLPSPRRLVLSSITATTVILGGNLFGVTSWLLGLDGGQLARQAQLDALFPVNASPVPFKRCIDGAYGYEFTYPASWLADQTVAYRAARRAEEARGLTMPALSRGNRSVVEPVAAYGPAGSTGEENVSVIVAPIMEGFEIESMGSPEQVATQFLNTIIPPGGPLEATLLGASSRQDPSQQLYYQMEYTVKGPKFFRHNISVITARGNQLYTFNAQVPEALWERDAAAVKSSAASFQLNSRRLDTTGFPART